MGSTRTRVECRDQIIVRWRARENMSRKQRVILLFIAALHVVADVRRDGLAGGRDAEREEVSIENKNHNTRVGRADQPAGALQLGWGARAYTLHAQSDKKGEATHF